MSEIDWKEGCRTVAEWAGQVCTIFDVYEEVYEDRWFVDWHVNELWPRYHEDDAHAWRLHKAIGNRMFVLDGGHGNYSPVNRGQMLKAHAGIFLSVDSWEKAQVLAAHELIEAGEKPLEVG